MYPERAISSFLSGSFHHCDEICLEEFAICREDKDSPLRACAQCPAGMGSKKRETGGTIGIGIMLTLKCVVGTPLRIMVI